jgi:hypothetical protein
MRSLEISDQPEFLRELLLRRKLNGAEFRVAVFRSEAAWMISGVVRFLVDEAEAMVPSAAQVHDYGALIIGRMVMPVDDAVKVLIQGDVGVLAHAMRAPEMQMNLRWQFAYHLGSGEGLDPVRVEWPSVLFEVSVDVPDAARQWLQQHRRLHGVGPLYPDVATGLADQLFGVDLPPPATANYEGMLHIVVPDQRARIRSAKLQGRNVSFRIDRVGLPSDAALSVDLYTATEAGPSPARVRVDAETAWFEAPAPIKRLLAHLVLGPEEVLDELQVGFPFARGADARLEPSIVQQQAEVVASIAGGEGRTIEFKRGLSLKRGEGDRSKEEFAETIAAFANADGGIVILGVDRNGSVVGFALSDSEAIDAIIGERCDPVPPYAVEWVELPDVGKTVMLVRVQRGSDPPYTINGTIYIRVGATDRRASRAELDLLKVAISGQRTAAGW